VRVDPGGMGSEEQLAATARALALQPRNREARRAHARALSRAGAVEAADAIVRAGLSAGQLRAIERGIAGMFGATFGGAQPGSDWHFLAEGRANLATIRHPSSPAGPLYTKVVDLYRPHVRREVVLNRALMVAGDPWATITPKVHDVRVDAQQRLALITSAFFEGERGTQEEAFEPLLTLLTSFASPDASRALRAALAPFERSRKASWLDRSWRDAPRIVGVLLFKRRKIDPRLPRWLDTAAGSLSLLHWLQERGRTLQIGGALQRHLGEAVGLWRRRRSWRRFDPARDFTLAHGDYGLHNVRVSPTRDRWAVFDFNALMAAPASIDLARILGGYPFDGAFVQARALPHLDAHAPAWLWNPPQRLLFLLLLLAHKLRPSYRLQRSDPDADLEPLLAALAQGIRQG
jgi:hypothetical protein